MENIGDKIKEIRDQNNLSQDRFGNKIGLSGKTISAYETNKSSPPLYVLEKISKVYRTSIFDIPLSKRAQITNCIETLVESTEELINALNEGLSL